MGATTMHTKRKTVFTFREAVDLAPSQFHALGRRAERPDLFDKAMAYMERKRFRCNIQTGTTTNVHGWMAGFVRYTDEDRAQYEQNPHFIFHDFFGPHLRTKYGRLVEGIDQE